MERCPHVLMGQHKNFLKNNRERQGFAFKIFSGHDPVAAATFLEAMEALYLDWNSKINVISRKDTGGFYLHHVLHSLAIAKTADFAPGTRIIDVGTGGGFPEHTACGDVPAMRIYTGRFDRQEDKGGVGRSFGVGIGKCHGCKRPCET